MIARRFSFIPVLVLATSLIGPTARCQNAVDAASQNVADAADDSIASSHLPPFSLVSVRLKLQPLIHSPSFRLLPIEIAEAWCQEYLGLDLMSVDEVQVIVGMPMGPGEPPIGALVSTSQDFNPATIKPELLVEPEPKQIGSRQVYVLGDNQNRAYLHAINARTFLIAGRSMLEPMAAERERGGPLVKLLKDNPIGDAHAQIIAAIEPARPMLIDAAQQAGQQLPPQLQDLTQVPELLDALVVNASLAEEGAKFNVQILTEDEAKAKQLLDILVQSIDFARQMAVSQMDQEAEGDGPVAEAQRAYTRRFTSRIAAMVTPKQNANRLVIDGNAGASVATTGVLVALLLPAVQAAREAARRTTAVNNLRQIGLALHNYHDAHKRFPPPAIVDNDGKPLLSWRVAILPYLDQKPLYDKFHLDEPWDSEHNIELAETVLSVYSDPSANTQPGHTVFQACVGEELAFPPEGIRIRDITDGTSNTIMVVETDASLAVPWTAPDDLEIDLDDPISQMGHAHAGGFQVLFGDGSVRFLTHSVDVELLRGMFTAAGGERLAF